MGQVQDFLSSQGLRVAILLVGAGVSALLLRLAIGVVNRLVSSRIPRPDFRHLYAIGLAAMLVHWGVHEAFVAAAGDRRVIIFGEISVGVDRAVTTPISFFLISGLLIWLPRMPLGRACLVAATYELLGVLFMLTVMLIAMVDRYLL